MVKNNEKEKLEKQDSPKIKKEKRSIFIIY